MRRSRTVRPKWVVATLLTALMLPPVASAESGSTQRVSSGPHQPPPQGRELARLKALHDETPDLELAGDITALVVTHTVNVKLAVDEEWRAFYGSSAWTVANNALESADNALYAQFGIDFVWYTSYTWDTYPDTARTSCSLHAELVADADPGTGDVLLGYSKNAASNGQGCAEIPGDEAEVNWHSDAYVRWVATQHELSHLFGPPDRYPDPFNQHANDVMEYPYDEPNFWCVAIGYYDWLIIDDHAGQFD